MRVLVWAQGWTALRRLLISLCPNAPLPQSGESGESPQPSLECVSLSLLFTLNTRLSAALYSWVSLATGIRLWREDVRTLRATIEAMPRTAEFAELRLPPLDYVDGSCPTPDSLWINRPEARERVPLAVLFIHGGGYIGGGAATYHIFGGTLAKVLGHAMGSSTPVPILSLAYPLAPDVAISEQVELAERTYVWLARVLRDGASAARAPTAPSIAIIGDSAGGGIAALLSQRLAAAATAAATATTWHVAAERDEGPPPPAPSSLVLLSPALEIRASGGTVTTNRLRDVLLSNATFRLLHAVLELNPKHTQTPERLFSPAFSALHGSWAELPPTYVWAAEAEGLADDATRAAEAIRRAGGTVVEELASFSFHEAPVWAHVMPEAAAALKRIARFMAENAK